MSLPGCLLCISYYKSLCLLSTYVVSTPGLDKFQVAMATSNCVLVPGLPPEWIYKMTALVEYVLNIKHNNVQSSNKHMLPNK